MAIDLAPFNMSLGRASRGHRVLQSVHSWHSQIAGSLSRRSLRPHWAQSICRRGKIELAVERSHTLEQVAHWKQRPIDSPPRRVSSSRNAREGVMVTVEVISVPTSKSPRSP